jgi:hypothetical protein
VKKKSKLKVIPLYKIVVVRTYILIFLTHWSPRGHMWQSPQPNDISMHFYSCWSSHVINIWMNQRLWAFGLKQAFGFVLGLPPRGGFWKWSKWPWNMIYSMPCRIHVDSTSIMHSRTPLVPQAHCEVNLDRLCLFHQWECLKCNGHGFQSRVWSGPKYTKYNI